MRVTSDFWVAALIRRVFSAGGFAAVMHRGSTEAGAIMILSRDRFGSLRLYHPAAQTSYVTAKPDERLFSDAGAMTEEAIEARLEKERRFDPDIWIVELELSGQTIDELITLDASE